MAAVHRRLVWGALFAGWLWTGATWAESISPFGGGSSQRSSSGRFSVQGPEPIWNLQWLVEAERFTSRLEGFLGQTLPQSRGFPLRLVRTEAPLEPPSVSSREDRTHGRFEQRIFVLNADRLDPRLLREHLAGLLLSRYVQSGSSAGAPRIPAWFVMGISEFFSGRPRGETYQIVNSAWKRGDLPTLRQVVSWDQTVPDRDEDRAACAAMIAWINARPNVPALASALMGRFALGEGDSASLQTVWPELGPAARDAEIQWNLWVASLEDRVPGILMRPEEASNVLLGRMILPGCLLETEPSSERPDQVTPAILLKHHGENWVRPAAVRMARSLSYLPLMRLPPELRKLRNEYLRWLGRVADESPSGRWDRSGSVQGLKRNLDELDAALREFRERASARADFLDRIERERVSGRMQEEARRRLAQQKGIRDFLDRLESSMFISIGEENPGR
jgi:hypothetical protein